MEKIPTAEEICSKQFFGFKGELWTGVHKAMVEFAKMHVEAALKTASEKGDINYDIDEIGYNVFFVDKESILNSYSLDNIK